MTGAKELLQSTPNQDRLSICFINRFPLSNEKKIPFLSAFKHRVSTCLSINHIDGQSDVELCIYFRHREASAGLVWPGMSDRTSGFGVFAWHVRHQSAIATLVSIRSSLNHPSKPHIPMWGLPIVLCIASSVTATIVTSFKVAFAFLRCDLRTTPITSRQRPHDDLITAKTTVSVIGSSQINHRQAVWRA